MQNLHLPMSWWRSALNEVNNWVPNLYYSVITNIIYCCHWGRASISSNCTFLGFNSTFLKILLGISVSTIRKKWVMNTTWNRHQNSSSQMSNLLGTFFLCQKKMQEISRFSCSRLNVFDVSVDFGKRKIRPTYFC